MNANLMLGHEHLDVMVRQVRQLRWRPTIKVIIHNGRGNFLSFVSSKHPDKLNFPGGGIDTEETAVQGLLRELSEEIYRAPCYDACEFSCNPLLATAVTDTSKERWRKKAQWLFGFKTSAKLSDIVPNEEELMKPIVHDSISNFTARLRDCSGTKRDTTHMYLTAVERLLGELQ